MDDILEEIEFIKQAASGLTYEQYCQSGQARRSIERSLEIISEATRGIPEPDKTQHPDIPWRQIRDLGNVLRHAYFGIMHDRIWAIIRDDLPAFEEAIRAIIDRYQASPK